jgi:hypothetical protein
MKKPRRSDPAGLLFSERLECAQQFPPFIAFWVQLATEFTSDAAPRTVLHAASTSAPPTKAIVTNFCTMIVLR